MDTISLKKELLQYCQGQVEKRYSKIKQNIADIDGSLIEEAQHCKGDSLDNIRGMLQIDRENAGKQLMEIEKLMELLKKIDVRSSSDYVRLGSLVHTDKAIYFISLSIGPVSIGGKEYLCVALNSPVGAQLIGKKKGEKFVLNNSEYLIESVI